VVVERGLGWGTEGEERGRDGGGGRGGRDGGGEVGVESYGRNVFMHPSFCNSV
jgi:hypothetical protein